MQQKEYDLQLSKELRLKILVTSVVSVSLDSVILTLTVAELKIPSDLQKEVGPFVCVRETVYKRRLLGARRQKPSVRFAVTGHRVCEEQVRRPEVQVVQLDQCNHRHDNSVAIDRKLVGAKAELP
jgi:hypothetical protein